MTKIAPELKRLHSPTQFAVQSCSVRGSCKIAPKYLNYRISEAAGEDELDAIEMIVACEKHQKIILFPIIAWGLKTKILDQIQ